MECRYKKFFVKSGKATTGECEYTYPECLKKLPYGCGFEEKFNDLYMDAQDICNELREEGVDL